jgi:hypothetical protein
MGWLTDASGITDAGSAGCRPHLLASTVYRSSAAESMHSGTAIIAGQAFPAWFSSRPPVSCACDLHPYYKAPRRSLGVYRNPTGQRPKCFRLGMAQAAPG